MSPNSFELNVRRDIIHYRVQIWTLTRPKHDPHGLVLKPIFVCLCNLGRSIVLLKNNLSSLENIFFICGKQAILQYYPVL